MRRTDRLLLVGVDGSPDSHRALEWALDLAARTDAAVRVVHACAPGGVLTGRSRALARDVARRAARRPAVPACTEVTAGEAVTALLRGTSVHPLALVVGARGRDHLGRGVGSVSEYVATNAPYPVVVVREKPDRAAKDVVVLLDPTASARLAVAFASWFADAADAPLLVVLAPEDDERREVEDMLRQVHMDHPDVPVTLEMATGARGRALLDASHRARLLAVGAPNRALATGAPGDVAGVLLHHARCPVAFVR